MKLQRLTLGLAVALGIAAVAQAQNYSDDVQLVSDDGNNITVTASANAAKKKDAETLAAQSAFHCLMHTGIDGLKGGVPMLSQKKNDYDYRLFNDGRWVNYVVGQPRTLENKKVAANQRATVQLTINLRNFKADLERNKQIFNPAWADAKKTDATSALNPTIVVVPATTSADGYSYEAMRRRIENHPAEKYAVERVAEAFSKQGFKTRDFIAQLQNSNNRAMLREGSQTDLATMMVQELPGDIVVMVGLDAASQGNTTRVSINANAVEKQTAGRLATKTFNSAFYHTSDTVFLVQDAIKKIEKDFFDQLAASFEQMIAKGREVNIEINLSETVQDWTFDDDAPVTGEPFRDALDEWLRANAFHGAYDMSRSTDKYIQATVNVPLWNAEKNRSYTLSNFGSDMRKFFKAQLGDDYKASVTSMGQAMTVTIQ